MKKRHKSNPTDINGRPEDLVENIMKYLPIQDAVRTSILSRKWRYAWTKLSELVFDDKFCSESILKTKSNLIKAINRVIFLHDGPLKSFILTVSNLESSCPDIDQFVLVVLKKGVDDLELRFKDEHYKLPSSVFTYGQQLKHLRLQSCVFKPPSGFNGFSQLETLELDEVSISGRKFSSIISHCPVLKSLSFKCFTRCRRISIAAPNLEFLRIEGLCRPLNFKNTPKLAIVDIYTGYPADDDMLDDYEASSDSILRGRLPVVKELSLDSFYLEFVATNRASALLVEDLCHLKILSLIDICFGFVDGANNVCSALYLIRNCPNLEKLEILVYTDYTASEIEFAEVEGVSLDHLKKVELREVSGLKCEVQLINFILANSTVLEKFVIIPHSDLVGEKALKFFKELSTFRRASPLVEIAYRG